MKRKQFDPLWKQSPFKLRCVKFFMHPDEKNSNLLSEFQVRNKDAINRLSKTLMDQLKIGKMTLKDVKNKNTADVLWKLDEDYLTNEVQFFKQRQKRGCAFVAMRYYRGYDVRNSNLPKSPPRARKWTNIYLQDGIITHKRYTELTGVIGLSIHGAGKKGARKIDVPYTVPKGMSYKIPHLSGSSGGQLCQKRGNWYFTSLATVPFEWSYQPVGSIGFDLNKTPKWFITLSDSINFNGESVDRLPHVKEITKYQKKLVDLNKVVKSKEIKSSQRRAVRMKIQAAHKKLEKACMPYCNAILDWVKEKKLLLCIDDLSCGAKHGSFGQDKVVKVLTNKCENMCIPFIVVPTPYTSKVCTECGTVCEERSKDKTTLTCPKCGQIPAHINGALNIKKWGWKIWDEGITKFNEFIKVYKYRKKTLVHPPEPKENVGDNLTLIG